MEKVKAPQGYVLDAFERREGRTVLDWLAEHGRSMTVAQASAFVGYTCPNGITDLAARYMPAGFAFRKAPVLFTAADLAAAIERNQAGEAWRDIALEYRRDVKQLKDRCGRYQRLMRDTANAARITNEKLSRNAL